MREKKSKEREVEKEIEGHEREGEERGRMT